MYVIKNPKVPVLICLHADESKPCLLSYIYSFCVCDGGDGGGAVGNLAASEVTGPGSIC